jgi:hypothetical protein
VGTTVKAEFPPTAILLIAVVERVKEPLLVPVSADV